MNVDDYFHHIPAIEGRIRDLQPDCIIVGLGPSAWLLPWLDQSLLQDVRWFGANDCKKLWVDSPCPVQDIVVMDPPWFELDPRGERYKHIVESRPERLWIFRPRVPIWDAHLPDELRKRRLALDLKVYHQFSTIKNKEIPKLTEFPYAHIASTPTGSTTLAWSQGMRRIGVIGVDLLPGHHKLSRHAPLCNWFFGHVSAQARELDGCIVNLSPFSSVRSFEPDAIPARTT